MRSLLCGPGIATLVEAHDALSARLAEDEGMSGVWASSLTIAATRGVRDANELTWTQVLDTLEHMADATRVPILADGDSGHGDFNTTRRFVQRLARCGIAGVCLEDQQFPKANSLLGGEYALASIPEFAGKIRSAKDAVDAEFVVVARVEALIAGFGLDEALRRAEAYHTAGADAILIHSRRPDPSEVLAFAREWAGRSPLLIVPTTYAATPVSAYADTGISALIWANHALRAAMRAMRLLYRAVREHGAPDASGAPPLVPLAEIFALTGQDELVEARRQYTAFQPSGAADLRLVTRPNPARGEAA